MPLVAGVDSSTQSTKVELRDAHTGERQGLATAPHPPTHPPRSEQDPEAWWAAFESCWDELGRPAGRGDRRRRPAARHGGHGRRRPGHPAGQALERHGVRARRGLADQAARPGRDRVGGGVRQRAGGGLHGHEAVVAAPQRAGALGPAGPGAAAPRLAHVAPDRSLHDRPRRRVGDGLLVARRGRLPLGPAADRGRRAGLVHGRPRGARPARRRRGLARRGRRPGDGRQHGGGVGPRACGRATWSSRSARRAPSTR